MSKGFNLGVILVVFCLGLATGYWLTPEYQVQSVEMKKSHDLGSADQWVDLRYIDGMIAHHLSAIHLLKQAQQSSDRPEIQQLAAAVIAADEADIENLYNQKKLWYSNTRSITQYQKVNLGSKDETFDLRLINALLSHHQEAIDTAKEVSTKSVRSEVLDKANTVTQSLSANADQLRQWRKEWYGLE